MGFNKSQLLNLIIRPTLSFIGLGGLAAENLLLGTCAQESELGYYLHQLTGPALGIYQMEPATFNDIYDNFLNAKLDLLNKVNAFSTRNVSALVYNLNYATALARIKYLRAPEALPKAFDIDGLASYWKKYYNTPNGAGTTQDFINNYARYVL